METLLSYDNGNEEPIVEKADLLFYRISFYIFNSKVKKF